MHTYNHVHPFRGHPPTLHALQTPSTGPTYNRKHTPAARCVLPQVLVCRRLRAGLSVQGADGHPAMRPEARRHPRRDARPALALAAHAVRATGPQGVGDARARGPLCAAVARAARRRGRRGVITWDARVLDKCGRGRRFAMPHNALVAIRVGSGRVRQCL